MGLFKKIANWGLGKKTRIDSSHESKRELFRRCHFEVMEDRRVLSADPVVAGVTYLEGDTGEDSTPDHFEITFQGGAETTQLTQFTINGDQDLSGGLSDGDMFFDINSSLPGTGGSHGFEFNAANSQGLVASDIVNVTVSEDGLNLIVEVKNFDEGDVLAFDIDVDEVERFKTDKIASGVEFEGSFFKATFVDQNYNFEAKDIVVGAVVENGFIQNQTEGIFFDTYDELLAEGERVSNGILQLDRDGQFGQSDRNAAAVDAYDLIPKPVTISGNVFHDENTNCQHDGSESGIGNVEIKLQLLNETSGQYETVATTNTLPDGSYEFGADLNLMPGQYRLVEVQPDGFLDVGATAGNVDGQSTGTVSDDLNGNVNVISDINIPLGGDAATEYNFCEVLPVSLSGNVWHDQNDDGVFDANEDGIANVLIQVTRVGAKDPSLGDAFSEMDSVFVRTDANGHYSVTTLPPGVYQVTEINNYPDGEDPLAAYVDGKDSIGNVLGTSNGSKTNDQMSEILLCAGEDGVEYNFGELKPASISGNVSITTPEGECLDPTDPNHVGIAGVEIQLYDANGGLVATTLTDQNGNYEFDGLATGVYSVVEVQPNGYLDGHDSVGNVGGTANGMVDGNDRFVEINLFSGDDAVSYNFCETEPASIKGTVYHDRNDNGKQDVGEEGIAGAKIALYDGDGNVVGLTTTDENGEYCFENLAPGEYCIKEGQPEGYVDGKDTIGNVGGTENGTVKNDELCNVKILGGNEGVEYNFGELKLAQISGFVHTDPNGNCVFDTEVNDKALANVTLELLDADGQVLATTVTDSNGKYSFNNLLPGEYSIRQIQPEDLFSTGQVVGDGTGDASTENLLSGIMIESGQNLTQYNFCEQEAAEIHGRVWEDGPAFQTLDGNVPDDYRGQRDGIYTAGVDTPLSGVRMQLYYYLDPDTNDLEPRPVTLKDVLPGHYDHVGTDPDAPIWVETMANGEYWFTGLQAGSYIVLESQPENYVDSNDMEGSTSGFTYNSEIQAASAPILNTFSVTQVMDAIANVKVESGGISVQNNFSEVRAIELNEPPVLNPPTPVDPQPPSNPVTPRPGLTGLPGLAGAQQGSFTALIGTSGGATFQVQGGGDLPYTWHLSVINAGQPRAMAEADFADRMVWHEASHVMANDWQRFNMEQGQWSFTENRDGEIVTVEGRQQFGMFGGTPLVGDFDGDGIDDVGVFKDGYFMLDINRNGKWDESDLIAKLGDQTDRPVVGDWDGDGKDDIGIYGPIWSRDFAHMEHEPGLPNPDNQQIARPKNVPAVLEETTNGARSMKLSAFGKERMDVVDHVFGIGDRDDVPVTGDWNGNGIRSIGMFTNGVWQLDVNGDGEFGHEDIVVNFGRSGDVPLVGDFNGDGIEEIAVYRSGTWFMDTNGNRELDASDKVFEMGTSNDIPVVGDWNGDGVDEPALYTDYSTVQQFEVR